MKRTLILASVLAGLTSGALAETRANSTEVALAKVKIDFAAAAKAAEAQTPGMVASLDVDEDDKTGEPFYKVEIMDKDGKEHKVIVNGVTGAVAQAPTDADHEGDDGDAD